MVGVQMRDQHGVSRPGLGRRKRSPAPAQMRQAAREQRIGQQPDAGILDRAGGMTPPSDFHRHETLFSARRSIRRVPHRPSPTSLNLPAYTVGQPGSRACGRHPAPVAAPDRRTGRPRGGSGAPRGGSRVAPTAYGGPGDRGTGARHGADTGGGDRQPDPAGRTRSRSLPRGHPQPARDVRALGREPRATSSPGSCSSTVCARTTRALWRMSTRVWSTCSSRPTSVFWQGR